LTTCKDFINFGKAKNNNLYFYGMKKGLKTFDFSLTAIMVKDPKIGGFTGYFKQFPNIIAEGETDKDLLNNLMYALGTVMDDKNNDQSLQTDVPQGFIEKSLEFTSYGCSE